MFKGDRMEGRVLPEPALGLVGLHRVREPGEEHAKLIRLDRNERLQPLPEWFMENVRESLQGEMFTRYPLADGLHRDLSSELGIKEEQLLLTPGSDAAIKAIYHAYVRAGDAVVMLEPSYRMYEVYARMFQARAYKVPFNRELEIDVGRLLDGIVHGVRLVMIANPNQPTGTLMNEEVLLELAARTERAGALLAIDEAYFPFSHTTMLPWVEQIPNLLVMRTFSKAAGLAGLRIGFVVGHKEVIANLYKVRSVHDINSMAILCTTQILKHPQIITDYVAEVENGGKILAERVRALELTPLPTHTNFMLIRVGHRCQPAEVVGRLRNLGYLIKGPFESSCLADCVRVTLGPLDLMERFVECLQDVLEFPVLTSR